MGALPRGGTPLIPQLTECFEAAREKKAEDIVILDLRNRSDITDYFVICHGTSHRQVLAIADAVESHLSRTLDLNPNHVEGRKVGEWVLMDYLDFVVHVFVDEKRSFYGLERLWGDAPRLEPAESSESSKAGVPDRRRPLAST